MKTLPSPHPLAGLLQSFFCQHLQAQRRASVQTIASYRDSLRLLLSFVQQQRHRAPNQQCLEDWDVPIVLRFLSYLEEKRHNSVRTRNARLAAVHAFVRYVGQKIPATTHQYIELDLKMKRQCLAKLAKTKSIPKPFHPQDKLLRFLQRL